MDSWTWEPGLCLHCFRAVDTDNNVAKGMYCSRVCQDQAEKVRYVRRTIRDGRLADPWVATTLCTNHIPFLALDLGYVRPPVTGPLRAEVLGRNEGLCAECLAAPATEVDHISGGSNDPDNLRGLCHPCHEAKPRGAIPSDLTRDGEGTIDRSEASRELAHCWQAVLSTGTPLGPTPDWEELRQLAQRYEKTRFGWLSLQMLADSPVSPGHNDENWQKTWPKYRKLAKEYLASRRTMPQTTPTKPPRTRVSSQFDWLYKREKPWLRIARACGFPSQHQRSSWYRPDHWGDPP